jgi:hypothetical protein
MKAHRSTSSGYEMAAKKLAWGNFYPTLAKLVHKKGLAIRGLTCKLIQQSKISLEG